MNRVSPVLASLCLLVSACAGSSGSGALPTAAAGSAGNRDGISSGGDTTNAGASALGGGANAGSTNTLGGSTSVGDDGGSGLVATGGTTPSGGQGGTNSAAGAGNGGGAGGGATSGIDYAIWVLQLPIGSGTSPTTISSSQLSAGFSNEYFYAAADGAQTFMDPATGITTSGSQHCRTEMRESTAAGGQAAWASSGSNTLTVSGKVLKVGGGASGDVTLGQVFNGTDSIPLCELSYSIGAGGFKVLYEEAKGGGTTTDLKTPIALNAPYTFTLALSKGVLAVSINGKQVYTHTPSAGALAKKFYFKFGNYDQTASAGPISQAPYTVVEASSATVVHQ